MGRLKGRGLPGRLGLEPRRFAAAPVDEAERLRRRDAARPNWYGTARWQALRAVVLRRDGYRCRQTGVALVGRYPAWNSPAVDHVRPHRWDAALFWDPANLQAVSKDWHDGEKQRRERAGEA